MEEVFVTSIKINEVLNIKDFEIPLSENERKHLIITGKNGSGKTTVLRNLMQYFTLPNIFTQNWGSKESFVSISIKNGKLILEDYTSGQYIVAFFEAKRNISMKIPTGINRVDIKPYYEIEDKASYEFIQYIVNQKANKSFAKEDNELDEADKIDDWFTQFEEGLFTLFDSKEAKLQFDRKSYNFNIVEPGKKPYSLNQLSDGYSSILNIVTELIMRMEEHKTTSYDVQGIVLIDEIETHLHIDLQKKVLPFLISFFPKIQFIVTTHSPFVITSVKNAVVCDLEKREVISEDLSGYSYEAIVEGYFDSDKYSDKLKKDVAEYEELMAKNDLSDMENMRLQELEQYLDEIPKFLSDELAVKLQQIKIKKLNKKGL